MDNRLRNVLVRADIAARQAYQYTANSYTYEAMSMVMAAVEVFEHPRQPKDYELWFTHGEPIRGCR